ncbi:MAG: hypothetical protein HYS13_02680 [Planctomycetia bacterium]|nr:hypothetical protein [Planctomycetia bacterium]
MQREILIACLPWLAVLLAALACLRLIVRVGGGGLRWRRLALLHHDENGAVQSLSFVLTVPAFIMVLMLIVQVSQLMIGTVVVHYAAYAAARSAIVWIPANIGGDEEENRISVFAPADAGIPGPGQGYRIAPGSEKFEKIRFAAVMACVPISPSRSVGFRTSAEELQSLMNVYGALDPEWGTNPMLPVRLHNKLAYSLENTQVEITFLHKESEPPIRRYDIPHNRDEFYYNEVGWQDPIKVTVTHKLALLPGPGRLLARSTVAGGQDNVSAKIDKSGRTYVRELTASVTMGNEGEKPVLRYRHVLGSRAAPDSGPAVVGGEEGTWEDEELK